MGAAVESATYTAKPSAPPPEGLDRLNEQDRVKDATASRGAEPTVDWPAPVVSTADDGVTADTPAPVKLHHSRLPTCGEDVGVGDSVGLTLPVREGEREPVGLTLPVGEGVGEPVSGGEAVLELVMVRVAVVALVVVPELVMVCVADSLKH